jgi:hypothetical protein
METFPLSFFENGNVYTVIIDKEYAVSICKQSVNFNRQDGAAKAAGIRSWEQGAKPRPNPTGGAPLAPTGSSARIDGQQKNSACSLEKRHLGPYY